MIHCPKSPSIKHSCSIPVAVAEILKHMSHTDSRYEDVLSGYMRSMCATCPVSIEDFG